MEKKRKGETSWRCLARALSQAKIANKNAEGNSGRRKEMRERETEKGGKGREAT